MRSPGEEVCLRKRRGSKAVEIVEVMRKNQQVHLEEESEERAEQPGLCGTRSQLTTGVSQQGISPLGRMPADRSQIR